MESTGAHDDSLREALAAAAARLRGAKRGLALTGAGVSAESGVPVFRGPEGLWRSFRPEELATPEAFARDPHLVWEWYEWRRERVAACRPNAAHAVLARLEGRLPDFRLVTQNVDGLHAAAGSRRLVELHGNLWRVRCTRCQASALDHRVPLPVLPPLCGAHGCGGRLRPDVVWFGEPLPQAPLSEAFAAARAADVVIVVGTSSLVYPAAALPEVARGAGAYLIEVNPEPTPLTPQAHVSLRGKAAELLPALEEAAA